KNQQNEFVNYVTPSIYSIRRYSGEDSMSLESKLAFQAVMQTMIADNLKEYEAKIMMEAIDENGEIIVDENGNTQLEEETFYINTQDKGSGQQFVFRNYQSKLVGDLYAKPSKEHILGLDGNAMDVLARIMYGGRVSLLIGFIVVIIEIVLGAIMGGISGYFGGIVDNIIMRIVDIFYCIPTMPILIILGAVFDQQRLPNLDRLIWMMAVLGFLGWPSIARIVRGQILSLREQDFMIAAESSGLKSSRKIFKHLIPNVMPQLIVQATMGLGSVILTESTLSFLGLGVKFPMATWGQIINSVSSISSMVNYTYIWIPVGLLICLAVIAFNFVGDGLRDAFDPRASR
nr:ABC transporter permease [Clostridia bacterium]